MTTPLAKPTPAQLAWHDTELGMFIHWSPGTYENTGGGHDTLTIPPSAINPYLLDTEQWVDVAEAMGAKYVVIVAKHVGGFCLWQQNTPASAPLLALASTGIQAMEDPLRVRKSTTLMASQLDRMPPCTFATQTIMWSAKCLATEPLPPLLGTGSVATPETARKPPKLH